MFRRQFLIILVTYLAALLLAVELYAQTPNFLGDAGKEVNGTYTITIKKIEISQDGNTWVTLADTEQSMNIASGNMGATIGSYVSNVLVPEGTYTQLRTTLSRTITIKGQGADGGTTYYTTTQNGKSADGLFYYATANSGDYEAATIRVPDDAQGVELLDGDMRVTTDISGSPLVIAKGQNKSVSLSFNTKSMIGFQGTAPNFIFYPMPPQPEYSEE